MLLNMRIDGVPYRKDRAARVAFHHPWRSSSFAMDMGMQGATMVVAGVLALDGCTLRSAGMWPARSVWLLALAPEPLAFG